MIRLGVDTGGTFTDFVLWDEGRLRVHKVLSTPDAPEQAILQGIRELGLEGQAGLTVTHGSTVATNAVLEGRGVRTVYVTNRGLGDVLTIGRQARRELYNLQPAPVPAPVPPEDCLETGGRLGADGSVVETLTEADLQTLVARVRDLAPAAVAVNLLFSWRDDRFERAVESALSGFVFVTRSSQVLAEIREYERGIATWLNAYVGPLMQGYMNRLAAALGDARLTVMQSHGGTIDAAEAGRHGVRLLLSGPAGGLRGAQHLARASGVSRLLSFDMGGTSTDVALLEGDIRLTGEGRIAGYPVAVPMVDM
ncbi:MAG TPA: hydantoinase/oxoprolinase family protein, partial [Thioalkalivibrio sp.]|nr:hydantoinase/oxoprolinase family protein [Thioalkalivibrio sp.]